MTQRKYLNLGCGHITLPREQPAHHGLVDAALYAYPYWVNVDRNGSEGVDECVDVFTYPFKWADNSFDGALLSHLVEHIPHEIQLATPYQFFPDGMLFNAREFDQRGARIRQLPDGFYAFFSELHRVLTDGAIAHILVPYAFSTGAVMDPTHHRYLTPSSFGYLQPNPDAPFKLVDAGEWKMEEVKWGLTPNATPYQNDPALLQRALETQLNIASEFYVKLRVIK